MEFLQRTHLPIDGRMFLCDVIAVAPVDKRAPHVLGPGARLRLIYFIILQFFVGNLFLNIPNIEGH